MSTQLHLDDIRRAWEAKDPGVVELVERLATQPDEQPKTPIREGALTFAKFLREIQTPGFHRKPREEQAHYRIEQLKALEAPDAEVPLPDRLKLHEVLFQLWQDKSLFARTCLLKIIASVRLTYGPWRALKKIFKEAEAKGDTEIYGALAARFDMAYAGSGSEIRGGTLAYLVRRAWRYLRRLGQTLPVCYADTVVDFLAPYTDNTNWRNTWVANHVFYHGTKAYNRGRFTYRTKPANILSQRAYPDLWTRSPRPLFALLERARSEQVREFATTALKTDFRAVLRDVEPAWVARLVGLGSKNIDEFVVWILNNVPRFEQASFRALGLHEAVLRLFDSTSPDAQAYAAEYARTHARDLPIPELVRLANNSHAAVRKLACDLLLARDPRKEVGLDAWGQLLETDHGHDLAAGVLRKNFGGSELTPEWFKLRLFSPRPQAFKFAEQLLPQIHPYEKLGAAFFADILDKLGDAEHEPVRQSYDWANRVANYALKGLERFDLNTLDKDFLRRLLLDPQTRYQATRWINEGRLKAQALGADFFKLLAFHPDWETDPWMAALKESGRPWAKHLTYDENFGNEVLAWLGDVRRFPPTELGFDWLMRLVMRSEERYHDFAVETMIKAFTPADFAPKQPAAAGEAAVQVDLKGASFVFTGKLATMQRKEAEDKVKQANGVPLQSVSAKLHYLVIGDEGSPLYGQGKKGSKQVKAEELNTAGANIKIISETAFLQMMAGKPQTVSEDVVLAGCRRLWEMAIAPGPGDAPLGQFARKYIRRHHPDLAVVLTERPVDPGSEIPLSFLTFSLVQPLFEESRKPLREFALDLAKWEFNRW
ncbi:MAG TPA: BRCT domain-containing protein, partial [Gemmataceae bacterium]|nr:BRCT domain-containing protein [Gemmataceae bacterium]